MFSCDIGINSELGQNESKLVSHTGSPSTRNRCEMESLDRYEYLFWQASGSRTAPSRDGVFCANAEFCNFIVFAIAVSFSCFILHPSNTKHCSICTRQFGLGLTTKQRSRKKMISLLFDCTSILVGVLLLVVQTWKALKTRRPSNLVSFHLPSEDLPLPIHLGVVIEVLGRHGDMLFWPSYV